MSTTINSYSVSLGMDASNFIDGAKVSRSEMRQLVKDIQAAQTPVEKFAVEQDRLKRALDSGAISQGAYNRILESKRTSLLGTTAAINPYTAAIGAITTGVTAASAATVAFIGHMRSVQNTIDDSADAATRLGVSFTDLKTLQFGFKEGAGIDGQVVADSIKKMQINMAKAVEGDQNLRDAFGKLGLDAGELIGRGPREAMLSIADAMGGVTNHAERLKLSMEIFGKSGADLASTLGAGSDALRSSMEFAEKWLGLTEQQIAMIAANNDAWDRVSTIVEGITTMVAAELAPVMQVFADEILAAAGGFEGVGESIRGVVDWSVQFVGYMVDAAELVTEIATRLAAIKNLDAAGMAAAPNEAAFRFDSGEKFAAEIEKRREEARVAASLAELTRAGQRHSMVLEDTDKEKAAKLKAIDDIAKEEERRRQEAEREANRNAAEALKNAERYFEEERKKQMKLQEDVARGPGSGMEAGSAEAARFMAEQANRAIAESTVKVDGKPTDEQLVEQAKIQLSVMRSQEARQAEMVAGIRELKAAVEDNGWEAVK